MNPVKKVFLSTAAAPALLTVLALGCQNDNTASESNGRVVSRTQQYDVTPGGTEVQTKTQIRETPGGQRVRETQMRTREDVTPDRNTGNTDPAR